MEQINKIKNCVVQCRVSSYGQAQEGESLEVQERIVRNFAANKGWRIVPGNKVWKTAISGRKKDRDDFKEILDFIKANPGLVNHYVFRSIDRFTRAGIGEYDRMNKELAAHGVSIVDTSGVIQESKNTLEDVGFEYDWSRFYPSEVTESVMATTYKQEATNILTRMIGQEIRLTNQGYRARRAADGYINKKIIVDGGKKKTIQVPHPDRSKFYIDMFELRAQGLPDTECVQKVNATGYKTPVYNRWDKKHEKIIGQRGGKSLTVKQFQRIIQNTIYAGVHCEKWTHYQPVRARYNGLVSIDLFNRANRGKIVIKENEDGNLELEQGKARTGQIRNRHNPLFPFKFIRCPVCNKEMMGSSPSGKSRKGFQTYHCSRNHKYFGINKKIFEDNLQKYINSLKFNSDIANGLEITFLNKFRQREQEIVQASGHIHRNVADLNAQQAAKIEAIVATRSPIVRERLEQEVDQLEEEIKKAQQVRDKIQITRDDIKSFMREAKQIMEHPAEFLLNQSDPRAQRGLFELVFEEMPTYEQILNGTPKLSYVFELSSGFTESKSQLVAPRGVEPLAGDPPRGGNPYFKNKNLYR
ncbi:MAG: recombinase family protein [Candidatus Gracilibacteria bacterium]|jgi:hypothetical protein